MQKPQRFLKSLFTILLLTCGLPVLSSTGNKEEKITKVENNSFFGNKIVLTEYPLIEKFRKIYMTENGINYLEKIMQKSVPYRDYIIHELEKNNMPEELLFLPVIESGFNEKAISKSGAVGIWQFMKNSIGGYNIQISEWIDERRDPWKTTDAAIKKLKYNYSVLHDWSLALAAYNAGLGAITRAITRAGVSDYWYLCENKYLKQETILYVPKFLAIAEILTRSRELNINWGTPIHTTETMTIEIQKPIDINILAKESNIEEQILAELNPSLKYNITPPKSTYLLRIPTKNKQDILNILNDEEKILMKYHIYKIQSGDTLYALSKHYGISVKTIKSYNKGLNPNALKLGQKIIIPTIQNIEIYRRPTRRKKEHIHFEETYIVKKGDTLWSIALSHGISVETLAEANNIEITTILSLGKELKVPKLQ